MTDPTRTEDVEEALEKLEAHITGYPQMPKVSAKRKLNVVRRALRDLRSALDSREDEGERGEDCTCIPVEIGHGRIEEVDPRCPVHADEPEGDEEHDEVLAGELDWLAKNCRMNAEDAQGRGDTDMVVLWSHAKDVARRAARQIRERGRPTDEPVSREGERFADAFAEGHALGWDDVPLLDAMDRADTLDPTHADARSSKTPDLEERTIAGSLRYLKRHAEKKRQYGIAAGIGDVLCRLSDSDGRAEDEDG